MDIVGELEDHDDLKTISLLPVLLDRWSDFYGPDPPLSAMPVLLFLLFCVLIMT